MNCNLCNGEFATDELKSFILKPEAPTRDATEQIIYNNMSLRVAHRDCALNNNYKDQLDTLFLKLPDQEYEARNKEVNDCCKAKPSDEPCCGGGNCD